MEKHEPVEAIRIILRNAKVPGDLESNAGLVDAVAALSGAAARRLREVELAHESLVLSLVAVRRMLEDLEHRVAKHQDPELIAMTARALSVAASSTLELAARYAGEVTKE